MTRILVIAGAIVISAGMSGLGAADKKVQLKDLPAAVQKTVQEQTRDATLKGLSEEQDKGATVYEVETTRNGRTRDLLIDARGGVIEVEEEVGIDDVPAAVRTAGKPTKL